VRSLQWTEQDSVYVPEIDDEHRAMFQCTQNVHSAVVAGEKPEEIMGRVERMSAAMNGHLRHEERLLRSARYPAFDWHKRQHATGRARLNEVAEFAQSGDRDAILHSLESLACWLRDHTGVTDRMAGSYLRNHQRTAR
jgi:hemerythrin